MTDYPIIVNVTSGLNNVPMLRLSQAPGIPVGQGMKGYTEFKCDMTGATDFFDSSILISHGQRLLQSLRSSNELVDRALGRALEEQNGTCRPLYFEIVELPTAESYCWEALCTDDGEFIALDRRWPVARVVESFGQRSPPRPFAAVFKMMIVLAPAEIDPAREWAALYAAVQDARIAGLVIELHVATCDESLNDEIFKLCDQSRPDYDKHLFPFVFTDRIGLISKADSVKPHLLHFFCHGSTSFGKPRLELAVFDDAGTHSIELGMNDLTTSPGLRGCWLVVLNCCDSGRANAEMMSLGASLVAGGMHAAIGMKEEVKVPDAGAFSEKLYPALMLNLTEALLTNGADDVVIEWSSSMWAPRCGLSDSGNAAGGTRAWTLPVIYVPRTEFRVRIGVPDPDAERIAAHNRTIDDYLALLPPGKRELLKQAIEAQNQK